MEQVLPRTAFSGFHVCLVDDGSTEPVPAFSTSLKIEIVHLNANLGHQKAIAAGLSYIHHHIPCASILIMDADGEDRADDAVRLLETAAKHPADAIIGQRLNRNEGFVFLFCYRIYKLMFRLLTGKVINFGHFMLMPRVQADRLVYTTETWNNLAAAVIKSNMNVIKLGTSKGNRIAGSSKMNFTALLLHGLSAIAVFTEAVAARLLIFSITIILVSLLVAGFILGIKLFTDLAIPGWASVILSAVLIVLLQGCLLSLFTLFLFLSSRSNRQFIPAKHYTDYVRNISQVS